MDQAILQTDVFPKNRSMFGLDASPQMCRQAFRELIRRKHSPKLVNGIGHTLPFCDAAFNQVVSTFPAPFIAELETMKEVYRILLPGGEFVVLLTAWFKGGGLIKRLWAWIFRGVLNPGPDEPLLRQHFEVLPWNVEVLTPEFMENNLLVIRCRK